MCSKSFYPFLYKLCTWTNIKFGIVKEVSAKIQKSKKYLMTDGRTCMV